MKYLLLALALFLVACDSYSPDPNIAMQQAALQIQATNKAVSSAQRSTVQAKASADAAAAATFGATERQVQLINARAEATMRAIDAAQAALDYDLARDQATREAFQLGLAATRTLAPLQATQTVAPTARAAAAQIMAAKAGRARAWAIAWPIILLIFAGGLLAVIVVLVRHLWKMSNERIKREEAITQNTQRQTAVIQVRNGIVILDPKAKYIDRPQNDYKDLNQLPAPTSAPVAQTAEIIEDPKYSREALDAIDLLKRTGNDNQIIPFDKSGWSYPRWRNAVVLLSDMGLVNTIDNQGTYLRNGTGVEILEDFYEMYSPPPYSDASTGN